MSFPSSSSWRGWTSVCLTLQQPQAASPSSHSSYSSNTPLEMASPWGSHSVSPKKKNPARQVRETSHCCYSTPPSDTKPPAELQDPNPSKSFHLKYHLFASARSTRWIIRGLKGSYFWQRETPSSFLFTQITFRVEHFRRCCAFTTFPQKERTDRRRGDVLSLNLSD